MSTRDQLFDAIDRNDIPTVSSLIASGSVNLNDESLPLHHAASRGRIDIMSLLLDAGADINAVDKHYQAASHVAIFDCQLAALKLLVERGADLAVVDADGHTLLSATATSRIDTDTKNQVVILLLDAGAPLVRLEDSVVLQLVLSAAVFERLSTRNIDLTVMRDKDGGTLCHHVAHNVTRENDLYFLINACGNDAVNAVDDRDMTPLHWVAFKCNASALRVLVELGADIDSQALHGWSTLHFLCAGSPSPTGTRVLCVELLLVLGANISLVTGDSCETACHLAASSGSFDVLCTCLAAGGDLDQPNDIGETARMLASLEKLALPTADEIDDARQRLAKVRLDLVRRRALQICLGLQSLRLNALQLCEIMMHSFGTVGSLISFHHWWAIATTVKHFRNKNN